MGDLTKNFSLWEFKCPDCGLAKPDPELVECLQEVRDKIGVKLEVTSGTRCYRYNRKIGGAPNSHHLLRLEDGMSDAADVTAPEACLVKVYKATLSVPRFRRGGIGVIFNRGRWALHLDIRRDGPARWGRLNGEIVPLWAALEAALARGKKEETA